MNVLIFGGGSVGLGIASFLLSEKQEVSILAREAAAKALSREGLIRTGIFGRHFAEPSSFKAFSDLSAAGANFDFILVCTKSYDSQDAAREIAAHPSLLAEEGRIILFQNGYGNYEAFTPLFNPHQVLNARVITGFCRPQLNEVEVTVHASPILIGSLIDASSEKALPLCRLLSKAGLPAELSSNIGQALWAKILYNSLLNPLGAIFGVPYGELGENEHSRELMKQIAEEAYAVLAACGYQTKWETTEAYLEAFYAEMLPPTAAHESSMLQDIRAGRRTEIDALNGAIAKLGKEHGIAVPCNDALTRMIRFLEHVAATKTPEASLLGNKNSPSQ